MDNITEDKIFILLEAIGFTKSKFDKKYAIEAEVTMYYEQYIFYKYFNINVTHPLYALKKDTFEYLFDGEKNKDDVYQMLIDTFKKEIRLNKIKKLLDEELHN